MTAIHGLFEFRSQLEREQFDKMREAEKSWGRDGNKRWFGVSVGLGQSLTHNTPESVYDTMPQWLEHKQIACTATARLDNRNELNDLLGISEEQFRAISDTELILRAYLELGEKVVEVLRGDWAFAVWHNNSNTLFLARDHHGCTSIYYCIEPSFFAFASTKQALLTLEKLPKTIEQEQLAVSMMGWHPDAESTVYDRIKRLPPAHFLVVSPEKVDITRYWYPENVPELRLKKQQEYVDALNDVVEGAITARIRSYKPIAVSLSGGLDSALIAAMAAKQNGAEAGSIHALSMVPAFPMSYETFPGRIYDESPYVQSVVERYKNIHSIRLDCQNVSPIEAIMTDITIHGQPSVSAANAYWIYHIRQTAREIGIGSILTGYGGNATLSWRGSVSFKSALEKLRSGQWKPLARQIRGQPWFSHLQYVYQKYIYFHQEKWLTYFPFRKQFLDTIRFGRYLRQRYTKYPGLPSYIKTDTDLRLYILKVGSDSGLSTLAETSAPYGIDTRLPLLDKQVIELCLSIPNEIWSGPDGQDRHLGRWVCASVLPQSVAHNPKRGIQSVDLSKRLVHFSNEVENTLETLSRVSFVEDVIDTDELLRLWNSVYASPDSNKAFWESRKLLNGLAGSLFLNSLM